MNRQEERTIRMDAALDITGIERKIYSIIPAYVLILSLANNRCLIYINLTNGNYKIFFELAIIDCNLKGIESSKSFVFITAHLYIFLIIFPKYTTILTFIFSRGNKSLVTSASCKMLGRVIGVIITWFEKLIA